MSNMYLMGWIRLNKNYSFSSEEFFSYNTEFAGIHYLNVVAGFGYYKSGSDGFDVNAQGYFTDAMGYDNIGIASQIEKTGLWSYRKENTKVSQFARLNYSLSDKYIVTVTLRRDGSSSFAEGKKYGIFPGFAFAWKMGDENFIKNLGVISDLKLRIGYGTTGNASIGGALASTLYANQFPVNMNGVRVPGVAMTQIGNPNITWETSIMSNAGIDFGFLNNRFTGTIDVYNKTTKDLLDYNVLPFNGSITSIADNVGSTRAIGFDFNLTSRILTGAFKWTNDFNVSKSTVNWVSRNPMQPLNPWVGEKDELSAIYGWKTDGIIKNLSEVPAYMPGAFPGNIKYVDENGDGILDANDVVNLGSYNQKWNLGMTNTFSFMNLDLSVFMYAKLGGMRYDGYGSFYGGGTVGGNTAEKTNIYNSLATVKEAWTNDNPDGTQPGLADNMYSSKNPTSTTNFNLLDASFLRIKNVTLGYTLPANILAKSKFLKSVRIYAEMDNLKIYTKWRGLDPEINEANPYPMATTTSFGVHVNF
ncbi:MAG: TonB-dependent receptor [Paludibacteraceae bacterium]|nr:TonB-dependent receptor [Paludibacteraceae bacterium]